MKGKCQVCKRSIKLQDGKLIYHEIQKRIKRSTSTAGCPGSFQKPQE